jgi:hypothetical protein
VAEHELSLVRKDGTTFQASLAITALWIGEEITGYMAVRKIAPNPSSSPI